MTERQLRSDLHGPADAGNEGLEATRTFRDREEKREKHTCIIGLTAHARRDIRDDCLKAGMDQVLTKPVQMKDLYSAVQACLSG